MDLNRVTRHPWAVSMLLHTALLVSLTWGLAWQRHSANSGSNNSTVSVELWAADPAQKSERVTPQAQPQRSTENNASSDKPDVVLEQSVKPPKQPPISQEGLEADAQKEPTAKLQIFKQPQNLKRAAETNKSTERVTVEKDAQSAQDAKRALQALQARQSEQQLELQRTENAQRIANMAKAAKDAGAATASPSAANTGDGNNAMVGRGFSNAYQNRISSHVRRFIVFSEALAQLTGNPACVVEVRLAPDGRIITRRVLNSSGLPSWDDAVLRALDKASFLPKDEDGRVPAVVELRFRPKT